MAEHVAIDFAGQRLALLADRAIWWCSERALLVADVHLGKGTSFRSRGMAIPTGATDETLARLSRLIERWAPERLIVLGDFLHARLDRALATTIEDWLATHEGLQVDVVLGNHDRALRTRLLPGLRRHEQLELGGIQLLHDAPSKPSSRARPALLGHWHPVVALGVRRSDRLRVPVFWHRAQSLVLPAFGSFTGGHPIEPAAADRVFAVGDQAVLDVTDVVLGRQRAR
ncbi:MAG: ligase-associated DNA damage response endonuclease PdeM [Pseudomonadota bacterium]